MEIEPTKVTANSLKKQEAAPLISVRNVTAGYGDKIIIRDVSFDVQRGEIVSILGRSGCGKTTLFKVMTGLIRPLSGEVQIDGETIIPAEYGGSEAILRKIGVMFQSGALFTSMTVAENVALPLRLHTDLSISTIEYIVGMKLKEVGLSEYGALTPAELSGGMQKRAALARAMALDPAMLFFDEPSAGLDPVTSVSLDEMILSINRHFGTTMIIVTHELPSILMIADKAVMLDREEKTVIAQGPPQQLMDNSSDPRVRDFFNRASAGNESGLEANPEDKRI
jgi:phospholipid/cholesterol/gamma-HCH transport system ATP-binding protein